MMPRDKGNNMRALLNLCGITFAYVLLFDCFPRLGRDPKGLEMRFIYWNCKSLFPVGLSLLLSITLNRVSQIAVVQDQFQDPFRISW